jgi:hypothetical protein
LLKDEKEVGEEKEGKEEKIGKGVIQFFKID